MGLCYGLVFGLKSSPNKKVYTLLAKITHLFEKKSGAKNILQIEIHGYIEGIVRVYTTKLDF